MKKVSFLFFLVTCVFVLESNGQSNDSLLHQLARKWGNAKAYTLKIAALMPEEDYSYKPTAEVMSFQEQLLHISDNMMWLSGTHLFADTTKQIKKYAAMDKAAVIKYVIDAYDRTLLAHYKISAGQLDEKVSFFAGPMTRRQILILMHDHQTHHAGELIVYLRLKGIKPPPYNGR